MIFFGIALGLVAGIAIGYKLAPDFKQVRCPACAGQLAVKNLGDYSDFVCLECQFSGTGR